MSNVEEIAGRIKNKSVQRTLQNSPVYRIASNLQNSSETLSTLEISKESLKELQDILKKMGEAQVQQMNNGKANDKLIDRILTGVERLKLAGDVELEVIKKLGLENEVKNVKKGNSTLSLLKDNLRKSAYIDKGATPLQGLGQFLNPLRYMGIVKRKDTTPEMQAASEVVGPIAKESTNILRTNEFVGPPAPPTAGNTTDDTPVKQREKARQTKQANVEVGETNTPGVSGVEVDSYQEKQADYLKSIDDTLKDIKTLIEQGMVGGGGFGLPGIPSILPTGSTTTTRGTRGTRGTASRNLKPGYRWNAKLNRYQAPNGQITSATDALINSADDASRGSRFLRGTGRLLGKAATPLMVGMAAADAYGGYQEANTLEASGEITGEQATVMRSESVGGGVGTVGGVLAGAALGQMMIPIPIVGAAIGGLVGGFLGDKAGSAGGNVVGNMINASREAEDSAELSGRLDNLNINASNVNLNQYAPEFRGNENNIESWAPNVLPTGNAIENMGNGPGQAGPTIINNVTNNNTSTGGGGNSSQIVGVPPVGVRTDDSSIKRFQDNVFGGNFGF